MYCNCQNILVTKQIFIWFSDNVTMFRPMVDNFWEATFFLLLLFDTNFTNSIQD